MISFILIWALLISVLATIRPGYHQSMRYQYLKNPKYKNEPWVNQYSGMMAADEQPMGEPTTLSDDDTSVTEIEIQDMDERLIKGWASVNVKDVQGDNIPIEVMKRAFLRYMMIVGGLLMFKHSNHPIGKIVWWGVKFNPEAGKYGIQVIAQLHSGYRLHDIVWEGVKQKIIKGFSLGAFVPDPEINTIIKDGQRIPTIVEMDELSPVFSPANPYATLDEFAEMAKSADDKDMLQFLDELKKAIEGCCGNSGNCEKKCGRCKSMENNKAQKPSPDIKRLEGMYGLENSGKLIEILSADDLMLISPPLAPEEGLSAGMSLGDIAAKHGIAMTDLEEELHRGIEVEAEHGGSPDDARKITMDHLTEDPKYYTKMDKMEDEQKENVNDIGQQEIETKTLENTLATMTKKKVYVKDPSQTPQGVTVQQGPKGGKYYESTTPTPGNIPKQPAPGKEPGAGDLSPKAQEGMKVFAGSQVPDIEQFQQKYQAETGKNPNNVNNKEEFFSWVADQGQSGGDTITAEEWNNTPKDYRSERNGQKYILTRDSKGTVLKPITVADKKSEGKTGDTISQEEWNSTPADYKSVKDGQKHILTMDPNTGGTILKPVNVERKKIKIGKQSVSGQAAAKATRGKPEEGQFPDPEESDPGQIDDWDTNTSLPGDGQKPRKGEAIRVPSAGGNRGRTGDRSVNQSWWEKMQNKKKELENLDQDPATPIRLVESIDMLITFNDNKANNPAIRQDLAKLQQVMDVDEDAKEMARDLLYFLDEAADMDAKALWNRFKVLYGPSTDPGTLSNEQYGEMKTMRKAMELKKSVEGLELNLMAKELKKSVDNLDRSIPSN